MKTIINLYILAVILLVTLPVEARECTQMEAYAAETVIDYLHSWKDIYKAFIEFGHCDDAAIAEGFDDAISIQWADQWETLPEMIKYTRENAKFKEFVYKRIGRETIPFDRWEKIVTKAKTSCPKGAGEFCREIIKSK